MQENKLFKYDLLSEIKKYFRTNLNKELCGVVLNSGEFVALRNNNSSMYSFQLDPKLYFLKKHFYCIVHSHPLGDAYPSEDDIQKARALNLPYLVYSCIYDNFVYFDLEKCIAMKG